MKKFLITILACATLLLCASCTKDKDGKIAGPIPSITDITEELLASSSFSETLTQVDSAVGASVYEINTDDFNEAVFYMSTGATAEEFSVFEAKDKDAAERILSAMKTRVEYQRNGFASYGPAEVPKLDSAIYCNRDNIVVLCVASDSKSAKDILDNYF